ncbi:peptidase E [Rossellomorea aquimaris]|uniref:Type 1 glutamine amidotransferase-like domain-containing protein n=1 Tax=Rossellomorea aquimaris TaxID=189382 RepID=UPI001CD4A8E2|nr:peptidase E [Rossellomorea aquimaris]MCA1054449.1 peptidase E [Rossellomorea aquimaris]
MKQIIAMGGGGFSMEPENLLLDQYILDQSRKDVPEICFLPTASGDADGYIQRFYHAFSMLSCTPSHLSLFKLPTRDLEDFIMEKDIIYVGGGNTKSMLALWREWGVDRLLEKAWNNGTILCGLSAGSLCWFEQGVTDSYGDELDVINALGFLKGSHSPHYDGEAERRPTYHRLIKEGKLLAGYGVDDGAALHFQGEELHTVVSSRPSARAYFVKLEGDGVMEEEVSVRYLGQ